MLQDSRPLLESKLLADDPEMFDLVQEFVLGLSRRSAEMRTALSDCNWPRLKTLGHQLKGAGGSFGYPTITEFGLRLENAVRDNQTQLMHGLLDEFDQISASALAGISHP